VSKSWPIVGLGEIFEIARGGSPRPIQAFLTDDQNGLNWIMISDATQSSKYITSTKKRIIKEGAKNSRMVKPGDFLLTNSMSFGRPYILKTSGCIHDGWLVLSPRNGAVDSDYFYHLLGSKLVYSEFERRAAGATVKNLNIELVKGVEISLPPLREQRRIADVLDRVEALRAKRRAALAELDTLTQAIFLDVFGDPVKNSRKWSENTILGEVAEIASGITKGRKLNGSTTRSVPYLAVVNVQDRALDLSVVKTIDATEEEIRRLRLVRDDLLLTEGGDPDKLGRGTLWNDELPECIHQNHIFRIRITSEELSPLFVNWLVGSSRGKTYFLRAAKQTTGIATINMSQLKNFPLLLPPIDLQREFGRRVAAVEKLKQAQRASFAELDALFASLQHRAFRGEL
jgi:type I restriction enzyme S subunit